MQEEDVQNLLTYMQDLSGQVKQAANEGKCPDQAMKDLKLAKYETWLNYGQYLAGNIERYCYYFKLTPRLFPACRRMFCDRGHK